MELTNLRGKYLKDVQRVFNYEVIFNNIPKIELDLECLKYTCRKVSIPGMDRKMKVIRFFGDEYTVALGESTTHEITLTFILDSEHKNHNTLSEWYNKVQEKSRFNIDVDAMTTLTVNLLRYDNLTINKSIKLNNVYPLVIPPIDGLDQDAIEGSVTFDVRFAFDNIER